MSIKKISIGDAQFQFDTSVTTKDGFLVALTEYKENDHSNVVEIYVGITEAKKMINVLQESINFSENLLGVNVFEE